VKSENFIEHATFPNIIISKPKTMV